jgi:4-hydroxyphenylacetate 3-monooxygenase
VTPDFAAFESPETKPWTDKYYTLNDEWQAEDRRKLLAFARDLISSDYAGHRLAFQMFAQSPRFNQLQAVYRNFDWNGPLDFVKKSAGLSDRVMAPSGRAPGDGAVNKWFSGQEAQKRAAE